MSVVHIENFPWSGDIASVREFFSGLAIPEGGVHILGGPKGDAFVLFETHIDANKALYMDGCRVLGSPVTLRPSTLETMHTFINRTNNSSGAYTVAGPSVQLQTSGLRGSPFQIGGFSSAQNPTPPAATYRTYSPRPNFGRPGQDEGRPGGQMSGFSQGGRNQVYNQPVMSQPPSSNGGGLVYDHQHRSVGQARRSRFDASPPVVDAQRSREFQAPFSQSGGFSQPHGASQHTDTYSMTQSVQVERRSSTERGRHAEEQRHVHAGTHALKGSRGVADTLRRLQESSGDGGSVGRDNNPFACCVVVSNFPIYISKNEIRNKFFGECKFVAGGLKLITEFGQKNAYMKFQSPASTEAALKRNGRQIDNKKLAVRTCADKEFAEAEETEAVRKPEEAGKPKIKVNIRDSKGVIIGPRPTGKKKGEEDAEKDPMLCVEASNMPNDVTARDMTLFFHSSSIEEGGVKIMRDKNGKGTGRAYIRFQRRADADEALKRSGAHIDNCRVVVSKCALEKYEAAVEKKAPEASADLYTHACNLPADITKRDITLFFHTSKLAADGIFIRRDSRRKGPAEAHLKFLTPIDVANAMQRNGEFIDGTRIIVQRSTQREYNQAVGITGTAGMQVPSLCALVSNLPDDVKKRDLTLFFHSSAFATDGIKLIHNARGAPDGTAYVKFKSPKDIENALKRHGASIESKRIAIQRCPHADFDKAAEHPRHAERRDQPRDRHERDRKEGERRGEKRAGLHAVVSNLPRDITQRDLAGFFQGVELARGGMKISADRHGNGVGRAYVKFASERDAKSGLAMHGNRVDKYRVSINECPSEEYNHAVDGRASQPEGRAHQPEGRGQKPETRGAGREKGREDRAVSRRENEDPPPVVEAFPEPAMSNMREQFTLPGRLAPPRCVHVTNVPPEYDYRDVQQFLSMCRIVPNGIKVTVSRHNPPMKEAYVRLVEEGDVIQALRRNGDQHGHAILSVKICSNEEFERAAIINSGDAPGGFPKAGLIDSGPGMGAGGPVIPTPPFQLVPTNLGPGQPLVFAPLNTPFADPTGLIINNVMHPNTQQPLVIGQESADTRIVESRFDASNMHGYRKPESTERREVLHAESFCVTLRNLPYISTLEDVVDFLQPARIADGPYMALRPNGHNHGNAAVQFATRRDFGIAMQKNRKCLRDRPISLVSISEKDFMGARERMASHAAPAAPPPAYDTCVSLKGLPEYTEGRHIRDLFRQSAIIRDGIHIFYSGNGKATGEGYVVFESMRDQGAALESNLMKIGSRPITVTSVSKEEMLHRLNVRGDSLGLIGANFPPPDRQGDMNTMPEPGPWDGENAGGFVMQNRQVEPMDGHQDGRRHDPEPRDRNTGEYDDHVPQDMDMNYYEESYPAEGRGDADYRRYPADGPGERGRGVDDRRSRDRRSPRHSRGSPHRRAQAASRGDRSERQHSNHRSRSPARSVDSRQRRPGPPPRDRRSHGNERRDEKPQVPAANANNQVFIRIQNLSDDVQMEDLVEFMRTFSVFPEMVELQCIENSTKEEGIAMFNTPSDAQKAVKMLNNRRFRRQNVKVFIGRPTDS